VPGGYATGVVLLPVAFGIAILALLVILRQERHEREAGLAAPRPLLATMTLAVFAVLAVLYVTVYLVSALTA
jgi:hypothetical protein